MTLPGQVLTNSNNGDPVLLWGPVFLLYQPYNENIFLLSKLKV